MENSVVAEAAVVDRKVKWAPLPLTNGGGIRSLLTQDGLDVIVEKRSGAYHFTATNAAGKVVFDNFFYTDSRHNGWATPHQARDAAVAWLTGR